jgi:hypothetical protein
MHDREDERPAGPEHACDRRERAGEVVDVGKTEVADDGVEGLAGERVRRGHVDLDIVDPELLAPARPREQRAREIGAHHHRPAVRELPRDASLPARELEHALPAHVADEREDALRDRVGEVVADGLVVEVDDGVVARGHVRSRIHRRMSARAFAAYGALSTMSQPW